MSRAPAIVLVITAVTAALAGPRPIAAQMLEGEVLEHPGGEPLEGAHLRLLDARDSVVATTYSQDDGAFRIAAPSPGSWRIAAELIGYGSTVSDSIELLEDHVVTVQIRMGVEPVRIEEPVVVIGDPAHISPDIEAFYRRVEHGESRGIGHFIYGESIERWIGGRASDPLRTVPGVTVSQTLARGGGQIVRMRAGCIPALYVDGSRINHFDESESLDRYVNVASIEGIEVYHGTEQPGGQFIDRSGCGVVLVWTQRGSYDADASFGWRPLLISMGLILALFLIP